MATARHKVSFRNGPQVMVAGLKLHTLGYGRGASVVVSDPAGAARNAPWRFTVSNDEHATLVSRAPAPPEWIQPGVAVQIEVTPAAAVVGTGQSTPATRTEVPNLSAESTARTEQRPERPAAAVVPRLVSDAQLREWRGAIVKILNSLEPDRPPKREEGLAGRISRLSREGRIPREIANYMHAIAEYRNRAEYEEKALDAIESAGVAAAWRVVAQWESRREA